MLVPLLPIIPYCLHLALSKALIFFNDDGILLKIVSTNRAQLISWGLGGDGVAASGD